ncbi:MAG: F0F1 ATP synthase subunit epsilon [Clostridia bacterium]|nr:F0F1 ATP synthase subunit epsilon [Clostridia bacterium]
MNTFLLTIASPDGNAFDEQAATLTLRGVEGELAVMAGHVPFVTSVKAGDCTVELPDGTERVGYADGGILSVGKDRVTLLAGSFRWKE